MPGTKSLSGTKFLTEAQDLMMHTPPANRWLPEVPLPLFFSFVPPFFCPGLMNRFAARPVTPKAIQTLFCPFMVLLYRFFKDLCRPLSRQFIKKRMAHLRQSIFCVKIPKHLDCAKGIADHDRRPATSCKLKRYYTLYRVDGLNFPLKASFLKMAQVRHSVFLVWR